MYMYCQSDQIFLVKNADTGNLFKKNWNSFINIINKPFL